MDKEEDSEKSKTREMESNEKQSKARKESNYRLEELPEKCTFEVISEPTSKTWKLFSRRNVFFVCYSICLIGCIYQMIEVLIQYLEYKTVTNLKISRSLLIVPPSMSICFPYISLMNLTLLFEKFPQLRPIAEKIRENSGEIIDFNTYRIKNFKKKKGKFDWDFGQVVERELTIREIMSVTVTLEELFSECVAKSPQTYASEEMTNLKLCEKIWQIDHYVKDESKCFLFRYKQVPGRDYVYELDKLGNTFSFRTLLASIRLKPDLLTDHVEKAFFYFHPWNRLPRGRYDPLLTYKHPAKNISYSMSYARIYNRLLEHPYQSDCKNYPAHGYESKEDCVEKCIIDKSLKVYGRVPYTLVFPKDSDLKVITYKELYGNETLVAHLQEINDECHKQCRNKDCVKEYFKPLHISTEPGTNLKFLVEIPTDLDIKTKLSGKQTFLEYLIYNMSVFGFWFGLCVLQVADFIEYLRKKRKIAKKIFIAKKRESA